SNVAASGFGFGRDCNGFTDYRHFNQNPCNSILSLYLSAFHFFVVTLQTKTQRRSFKISSIEKIEIPRKATGHAVTEKLNFSRIYSVALIIHQEDRNVFINKRFIANIQV
ncbi:hypothetical protein, partial [Barnesiella intestinihominis]|uniref:hypothetical protein n=1 Tax=Barnesiella intestinihominis TaxID=487174 RepID=UPI003AB66AB9